MSADLGGFFRGPQQEFWTGVNQRPTKKQRISALEDQVRVLTEEVISLRKWATSHVVSKIQDDIEREKARMIVNWPLTPEFSDLPPGVTEHVR